MTTPEFPPDFEIPVPDELEAHGLDDTDAINDGDFLILTPTEGIPL